MNNISIHKILFFIAILTCHAQTMAGTDKEIFQLIKDGNVELIEAYINDGRDINTSDQHSWTPLMAAVNKGDIKVVKLLLDNDVDVNAIDEKMRRTALDLSNYLIERKVSEKNRLSKNDLKELYGIENLGDVYNDTMKGFSLESLKEVKLLLERYGAKPYKELVPEVSEYEEGSRVLQNLIKSGFDVNAPDQDGMTPIMYSAQHCDFEMVKELIKSGAKIELLGVSDSSLQDYICTKKKVPNNEEKIIDLIHAARKSQDSDTVVPENLSSLRALKLEPSVAFEKYGFLTTALALLVLFIIVFFVRKKKI